MNLNVYHLNDDKYLDACSPDDYRLIFDQPGSYWLDIEEADAEELFQILSPLKLHPLVLEDCLNLSRSSLITRYERTLYLEFPVNLTEQSLRVPYVSVIGVPNILITVRRGVISSLTELAADLLSGELKLYTPTTSALLYTFLDHLVDQNILLTLQARNKIDALMTTFDEDPDEIEIHDILEMKRHISQLAIIGEDQLYCVTTLIRIESRAFTVSNQREYFRDMVNNAEYGLRFVQRQERRLRELQDHYQLTLHNKTEARLRFLTIISAVFLPLTLVSSIYGMNFDRMPELHWVYGYPFALTVMLFVAAGMVWFFYKRDWFE
ncbi:MAG: hypothetical protein KDJ65_35900 [Anaerolineae bacterium]|nr:hypothetical protein [Anaerolineae bacterium]